MFVLFKSKFTYLNKFMPFFCAFTLFVWTNISLAQDVRVGEIRVTGNHAVQSDAIIGIMSAKVGGNLNLADIKNDIRAIYKSGFFQDVKIESLPGADKSSVVLLVVVEEKPVIAEIKFEGFREVTESSITDKLLSKKYAIVDEKKIGSDIRTIEQMYIDKSYYLARVSHSVKIINSGEAHLVFQVTENNPISVAKVSILGNTHFSDTEIKDGLMTTEKRWSAWLNKSGMFRDEFVGRDKEYLSFLYKDNGYIDSDIATPQSSLNVARQRVNVTFSLEEGVQYYVGSITFSGDLIFTVKELKEKLALKEKALFKITRFQNDVKLLTDLYGDEGYAFAYIYPKTVTNRDKRIVDIVWDIKKGEKAYFRTITIEGNVKTRDNVIRRNVRVTEGERFSATKLDKSKEAIDRLGFFESVVISQEPDVKNNSVDLRVKVKEKSTGNLSAQIGASPTPSGPINYMAQGSYGEANFLGYGWDTSFSGNISRNADIAKPNWGLNLAFTEPSIRDSLWSATTNFVFNYEYTRPVPNEPERASQRREVGLTVGRELLEDLRFSVGYGYERVVTEDYNPILKFMTEMGDTERIKESLVYDKTNNYRAPTEGYYLSGTAKQAIRLLGGDYSYSKIDLSAVYYLPINFTDTFQTNFRFALEPGFVAPLFGHRIPIWERLQLGNQYNMRAYQSRRITPTREIIASPWAASSFTVPIGGTSRYYASAEYFIPLIPEANLRLVTFAETGAVLNDEDKISLKHFKSDVGMGIRWITPIAPFRFEWAWPIERKKMGEGDFVLAIGLDNAAGF